MTFTFTLTFMDVLLFILVTASIVLVIFLILFIKNLTDTLKYAKGMLCDNRENIDATLEALPAISKNVEKITGDVKNGVDAVSKTTEIVEEVFKEHSETFLDKTEVAVDYIQILIQLVKSGLSYWENRKKK